jgi:hypothetical protein
MNEIVKATGDWQIKHKSKVGQLFCRHEYHEGALPQKFLNLNGTWVHTICVKCGKEKSKRFIPDP